MITSAPPFSVACAPSRFVLGVGCAGACEASALRALALAVLAEARVAPEGLAALATVDRRCAHRAVRALAEGWRLPLLGYEASVLDAHAEGLSVVSLPALSALGCRGVAEAAALAGVGAGGRLVVPRRVAGLATAALAQAPLEVL